MRPYVVLLSILITLLLIIGVAQVYEPLSGLTGANHPNFKGMKVSPDNTDLHNHTKWMGYLFAMGLIAMFTTILIIGSRRASKNTGMFKGLVVFGIVYAFLFTMMILANWSYVNDPNHSFFWQMPKPTAWMIYVVWLSPLIVAALYVFNFERWVISPEDEAEIKNYLEQQSK